MQNVEMAFYITEGGIEYPDLAIMTKPFRESRNTQMK